MQKTITTVPVSLAEIRTAQATIAPYLRPTPLHQYRPLSTALGCDLYVKHENHNITGSFKIRGGINLMHNLKQQGVKGVITFSTGNHGLSIATAASIMGISATIAVPVGSTPAKINAIGATGAELIEFGKDMTETEIHAKEIARKRGLYLVHPANNAHLLNGVGTGFLEIAEAVPDLDAVFKAMNPSVEIIAVQAKQAQGAYASWQAGKIVSRPINTDAGGVATPSAYELPFSIYKDSLADFVLLTEPELDRGMAFALHYTHNLTERAGSASLMAAFKLKERLQGKKVAIQMSGCNASAKEMTIASKWASLF